MLFTRIKTKQSLSKNIKLFQHQNQTKKIQDKLKQHQKRFKH
jgi:hypothetical protein